MERTPEVSFVVPCYNYGRYLAECLQSILGLEGQGDFEIIAIDDGSTDNTQEVLKRFSDPRLKILTHSKNQGHVATINEGLSTTRGRFVARIDPDDRYLPNFLTATLEKFRQFPEVDLVYGEARLINENGEVTQSSTDCPHRDSDFQGNELVSLLERNFICAPTVIARREAWVAALPVPPSLAFNDWYFTLKMAQKGPFCHVHQVVADYRVHPMNFHSQIVRDKSDERSMQWLLDRIFEQKEISEELERDKQAARRRIFSAQYLTLADKYFGFYMDSDARRCYWQAAAYRQALWLNPVFLRRLWGSWIGRKRYERIKGWVR